MQNGQVRSWPRLCGVYILLGDWCGWWKISHGYLIRQVISALRKSKCQERGLKVMVIRGQGREGGVILDAVI